MRYLHLVCLALVWKVSAEPDNLVKRSTRSLHAVVRPEKRSIVDFFRQGRVNGGAHHEVYVPGNDFSGLKASSANRKRYYNEYEAYEDFLDNNQREVLYIDDSNNKPYRIGNSELLQNGNEDDEYEYLYVSEEELKEASMPHSYRKGYLDAIKDFGIDEDVDFELQIADPGLRSKMLDNNKLEKNQTKQIGSPNSTSNIVPVNPSQNNTVLYYTNTALKVKFNITNINFTLSDNLTETNNTFARILQHRKNNTTELENIARISKTAESNIVSKDHSEMPEMENSRHSTKVNEDMFEIGSIDFSQGRTYRQQSHVDNDFENNDYYRGYQVKIPNSNTQFRYSNSGNIIFHGKQLKLALMLLVIHYIGVLFT